MAQFSPFVYVTAQLVAHALLLWILGSAVAQVVLNAWFYFKYGSWERLQFHCAVAKIPIPSSVEKARWLGPRIMAGVFLAFFLFYLVGVLLIHPWRMTVDPKWSIGLFAR